MDRVEYYEKVMVGKFMTTTIGMFSILWICVSGFLAVKYSFSIGTPLFAVIFILPILLIYLLLAIFCNIKITITTRELIIKYGFFHEHISLCKIESCEQVKAEFKKFLGLGIRIRVNTNTIAYLAFFGNAVRINRINKTALVFSTNHPDKICHIISTKKQQSTS
jgi:hypothetical protein